MDVFSRDISHLGYLEKEGLFYCFPPFALIGNFLAHLQKCAGKCVVILPESFGLWYPRFMCGVGSSVGKADVEFEGGWLGPR